MATFLLRCSASLVLALAAVVGLAQALHADPAAAQPLNGSPSLRALNALPSPLIALPQVITTVQFPLGIGMLPTVIGMNDTTGYAYIAGSGSTAVVSGTQIVASLPTGSIPIGVGVNPVTGYVYVVDRDSGITILSGTQVITTVTDGAMTAMGLKAPTGPGPVYSGIGVNPVTGYVYVSRAGYGTVMVLSATHVITSIEIGYSAGSIGVNPDTGYIYVASESANTVTILSGTQVITTVGVGPVPTAIGVNRGTGYVYVGNAKGNSVTVISATQVITTLSVGSGQHSFAANPQNGYVYVANDFSDNVTVISSTQVMTTLTVGDGPAAIGVNAATGDTYVANYQGNSVTVISATQIVTTMAVGPTPYAVGINSMTGYIYLAHYISGEATILRDTQVVTTLATAVRPYAVGVNPLSRYAYVADYSGNSVLVLSNTQVITTLPAGWRPVAVHVSPANGFVYVPDTTGDHLTVIFGTEVITTLQVGEKGWGAGPIGVDAVRGLVYVGHVYDDQLIVISGSQIITQVTALAYPNALMVDAATGYVYETSLYTHFPNAGGVAVISGAQVLACPPIDFLPVAMDINPATGDVYVVSDGGKKVAILHGTQVIATVSLSLARSTRNPSGGGVPIYPGSIGVDVRSGYVYVTDYLSGGVKVLSGAQVITTLLPNQSAWIIGVSPSSGYVYVTLPTGATGVLGQANNLGMLSVPAAPRAIDFDPATRRAYLASYDGQSLAILQEPIVPRSLTPFMLDAATTALEIDFEEPIVTSTIQFEISPNVALTVTWDISQQRASVQHAPFQAARKYSLSVLSGGLSASQIPVAEALFEYIYYPYHFFLPLVQKHG